MASSTWLQGWYALGGFMRNDGTSLPHFFTNRSYSVPSHEDGNCLDGAWAGCQTRNVRITVVASYVVIISYLVLRSWMLTESIFLVLTMSIPFILLIVYSTGPLNLCSSRINPTMITFLVWPLNIDQICYQTEDVLEEESDIGSQKENQETKILIR